MLLYARVVNPGLTTLTGYRVRLLAGATDTINIQRVDSFSDTEATVAGQVVPLGRQYREAFLKQFMFR